MRAVLMIVVAALSVIFVKHIWADPTIGDMQVYLVTVTVAFVNVFLFSKMKRGYDNQKALESLRRKI